MNLPDGFVLDGELYAHGKALQSIGGIARKGMSDSWNKMTDKQKEAASEKKNELYVRVYAVSYTHLTLPTIYSV